ncbi:ZIP zinc transporter [Penicillium argentinense]|uniref:ZIP zinc transporter n=1 Tax=Penicillium argentinense TaxID=1131581 RepID=A0A9W9K2N7_9EURO|nr:ZIP zinc transporter [Penicillium argentinense]KAJ5090884.1 ZIP zinc transporter [Penicillium argentinense]
MRISESLLLFLSLAKAYAATATTTSNSSTITGCHSHGSEIYCIDGDGEEVLVSATSTPTGGIPAQYTGCHSHGSETYCMDSDGNEALIEKEEAHEHESESSGESSEHDHSSENSEHDHSSESSEHDHSSESSEHDHGHNHEESESSGGQDCHFHAGVEHCVGAGESESSQSCGIQSRDYDVPLRIGTLFVVLVTSAIGVFAPILLARLPFAAVNSVVMTIIKQFGTGIIIATAFVHLYTHANLMFTNECLGELDYEATTSAVVMAGIFLAFLFEYVGHRIIVSRGQKTDATCSDASGCQEESRKDGSQSPQHPTIAHLGHSHGADPTKPDTKFSVLVMEAGVLFHSILIGLTLVVAGDSFYKTLLVVIVFHQFFEGLALGARISTLSGGIFPLKAIMAGAFALITPIGMAIGLGVLNSFNGNERSTLIALGTLDALSAGILVWVGVVDMWARDWVIEGGEMLDAALSKVLTGGVALVSGLVLMGLLGKWA